MLRLYGRHRLKVEGKHRFFGWLMLRSKILTTDKLLLRNWPCNPLCALCQGEDETAKRMCIMCTFALQVWQLVHSWTSNLVPLPMTTDLQEWWWVSIHSVPKEKRRAVAAVMIYTCSNLWNERNRRIFQGVLSTPQRVFTMIKEEIALRQSACGAPVIN